MFRELQIRTSYWMSIALAAALMTTACGESYVAPSYLPPPPQPEAEVLPEHGDPNLFVKLFRDTSDTGFEDNGEPYCEILPEETTVTPICSGPYGNGTMLAAVDGDTLQIAGQDGSVSHHVLPELPADALEITHQEVRATTFYVEGYQTVLAVLRVWAHGEEVWGSAITLLDNEGNLLNHVISDEYRVEEMWLDYHGNVSASLQTNDGLASGLVIMTRGEVYEISRFQPIGRASFVGYGVELPGKVPGWVENEEGRQLGWFDPVTGDIRFVGDLTPAGTVDKEAQKVVHQDTVISWANGGCADGFVISGPEEDSFVHTSRGLGDSESRILDISSNGWILLGNPITATSKPNMVWRVQLWASSSPSLMSELEPVYLDHPEGAELFDDCMGSDLRIDNTGAVYAAYALHGITQVHVNRMGGQGWEALGHPMTGVAGVRLRVVNGAFVEVAGVDGSDSECSDVNLVEHTDALSGGSYQIARASQDELYILDVDPDEVITSSHGICSAYRVEQEDGSTSLEIINTGEGTQTTVEISGEAGWIL